jgi:hypothetical protein
MVSGFRRYILDMRSEVAAENINNNAIAGSTDSVYNWVAALKKISLLVLILPFFFSCVPDPLEVRNIPVLKQQIVVNTQILPGGSLIVLLTKTIGALDASDNSDPEELLAQVVVNDAIVTIEGPAGIDTLLYLENGVYGGVALSLQEGETYFLRAVSESLGKVSATATVEPQVFFDSVTAELYPLGDDDTLAQITYQLNDPVGKNHYMINVQRVSTDINLGEQILNPRSHIKLLDDTQFDGRQQQETFRAFPRNYSDGDTIAVFLSNISEDYYKFIQLRLDTRFSFVEFIGEPINYPSNVTGGRGFFNLYIPDVRLFVMQK